MDYIDNFKSFDSIAKNIENTYGNDEFISIQKDYPEEQRELYKKFLNDKDNPDKHDTFFKEFEIEAENGVLLAQFLVALMLLRGIKTEQNIDKAVHYL
jgi:TPR repeat protein